MRTRAVTVAVLIVALAGCGAREPVWQADEGGSGATEEAPLVGTEWHLVELDGEPVAPGPGQPHFRLIAAESRFVGFGGCNRIMGGYVLEEDALRFSDVAATRMACADGMDLEDAFLEAIGATTRQERVGGLLELHSDDRLLARFEPGAAEEAATTAP